jgi:hypothetical protein
VSEITLVPAEFTLVKFDAAEVRRLTAAALADAGFPDDVDVTVEIDEVLPHPLTASAVEVGDGEARLWFAGGCFENPQKTAGLSIENTQVELISSVLRAKDRLVGGFEAAPADDELTDRQRAIWDTYAEARAAAAGYPVRVQRRRYVFRLYGGFNDVADAEFERLWAGGVLDWASLEETAERLAAADTRPERKKAIRRESLRQTAAS